MREIIDQIEQMLVQKKQKFETYENVTEQMLTCEWEEMQTFIENREDLIEEITKLDESIQSMLIKNGIEKKITAIIKNKVARGAVADKYLNCYDLGQNIFTVLNRITNMEPDVLQRATRLKEEAEQGIRKNSHVPKIATYFNTYEESSANILVSKKYEKV